jgi:hypothetical protein
VFDIFFNYQELDLTKYEEAMVDANADKWQVATDTEIESMYLNQVRILLLHLKGLNP